MKSTTPDWPTKTIHRTYNSHKITLQVISDFDAVLDYCAEHYPDNTDMIPYYADLWPSAEALAQHIADNHQNLSGKRIIELGCGLGLPSLLCAKLGADVTATDFHPHNKTNFNRNALNNNLNNITYRNMDWSRPHNNLGKFDIIIGSDLLYEAKQIKSLTSAIPTLLAPNGTFILADPGRDHIQTATDSLASYHHQITIRNNIFIITFSSPNPY